MLVLLASLSIDALIVPTPVVQQYSVSVSADVGSANVNGVKRLFPSTLLIAEEETLSPAKAKILAAKAAAAEKATAGGYKAPAAKTFTIDVPVPVKDDPFKEADELKAKIRDLQATAAEGRPLSKSKSAQVQSLKSMEAAARDRARAKIARDEYLAQNAETKAAAKLEPKADKGSFSDEIAKVTGFAL
jgi:hypothetical protein